MALFTKKSNPKKSDKKPKGKKGSAYKKSFGPPAKTFDEAGVRAKKRMAMMEKESDEC